MKIRKTFYQQIGKHMFDFLISLICLFFLWPIFFLIAVAIGIDSEGPMFFKQKRTGIDGRVFLMYKFRTMVTNAEEIKKNYLRFNEANGPVFKIKNDPRFTHVGKFLARTGLDELPQLINVLKGEMSLVGPRPLPVLEAAKIPAKIRDLRESILPGMTSNWVISGTHSLSFNQWMSMDVKYAKSVKFFMDLAIILQTVRMMLNSIFCLLFTDEK